MRTKAEAIGELMVIAVQFIGLIVLLSLGLWKMMQDDKRAEKDAEFRKMTYKRTVGYYDTSNAWARYTDSIVKKLNYSRKK